MLKVSEHNGKVKQQKEVDGNLWAANIDAHSCGVTDAAAQKVQHSVELELVVLDCQKDCQRNTIKSAGGCYVLNKCTH
jgi:hypothetical protein